jgi:hypothetical protein
VPLIGRNRDRASEFGGGRRRRRRCRSHARRWSRNIGIGHPVHPVHECAYAGRRFRSRCAIRHSYAPEEALKIKRNIVERISIQPKVMDDQVLWQDAVWFCNTLSSRTRRNLAPSLRQALMRSLGQHDYDGQMSAGPRHETLVRTWTWRRVRFVLSAMLLCQAHGYAQLGPQPPCGKEPVPPYPGLDDSAIVKLWSKSDFGRDWTPPACTGWAAVGFTTLVTVTARFRQTSGAESLLRHIGAISELRGMRYWSTSHKQWQTLIVDAYALTSLQPGKRREAFTPDEMKEGKVLYFEQVDNLSGKANYRMHIAEASADRLVVDVENVSTMRHLFIPILGPGEMQSIYFLDRESENVWRYYSIVRTGKDANRLITGNESSAVNRAVAFYRWLVGIPTGQEPPAAR